MNQQKQSKEDSKLKTVEEEEIPDVVNPDQHKKILERYLPEDREVKELDLFALSRLPLTLEQKIVIAKNLWTN